MPPDDLKPIPHSIEAERSVIGAVLLDNKYLPIAAELLTSAAFFHDHHRRIWKRILDMQARGLAVDLVTLKDDLIRVGELDAAGGVGYIAALVDGVPRVSNVAHYAQIVREKSLLRRLTHLGNDIQQEALDTEGSSLTILEHANTALAELANIIQAQTRGLIGVGRVVTDSYPQIEKMLSGGRVVTGLSTGYADLDMFTAGLQPSDLIILAARPGVGKTSLCLNIAENVASKANQAPIAIFSLEMSATSLLLRLVASQARVDAHKFRTGHITRDDVTAVTGALATISRYPLWIDDSASITVLEIAARAKKLQREHGLGLVIVDYIQLISSPGGDRRSRQEEVAEISRALKALAKDLHVPVLVLSQLTRAPEQEGRRPQLSDLRQSGAIEQDADVVLFIHRPNFYKATATDEERAQTELIIAKQRNGPVDMLRFIFLGRYTRFEQAAPGDWKAED